MDQHGSLPRYRNPPLIEVVHGVQFGALPLTIVHPGLFHEAIRDRYPIARSAPPLAPVRETFRPGDPSMGMQIQFQLVGDLTLPRAWYISQDGVMLAQMQADRLHLNWRRRAMGDGNAIYPHFETVSQSFAQLYRDFAEFAGKYDLGELQPEQCELTYINHMEFDQEDPLPFDRLFRGWNGSIGPDWRGYFSNISISMQSLLTENDDAGTGKLYVNVTPIRRPGSERPFTQMELTVRGLPSQPNLEGVLAFHEFAHRHIVRSFTALTTPEAHERWDRYQ